MGLESRLPCNWLVMAGGCFCMDEILNGARRLLGKSWMRCPMLQVEYLNADLSSLNEVRQLARTVLALTSRLDALVNNAGGFFPQRQLSRDGLEMNFAVNHLAHFLLTNLLLGLLQSSAPARVVTVSSVIHRNARLNFEDLQFEQSYNGTRAYATSKLMNVLFAAELARRMEGKGVTSNSLHPGWWRPKCSRVLSRLCRGSPLLMGRPPAFTWLPHRTWKG